MSGDLVGERERQVEACQVPMLPYLEAQAKARRLLREGKRQVFCQMVSASLSGSVCRIWASFHSTVLTKAGSLRRDRFFSGAGVR